MTVVASLAASLLALALPSVAGPLRPSATASSTAPGSDPAGALDADRFSPLPAAAWHGAPGASCWWWQVRFPQPRAVGAILQVVGDHPYCLRDAPRDYVWQASTDGQAWEDLKETAVANERRTYRLHRLARARQVRSLRLWIRAAEGAFPVVREAEFYADPQARVAFEPWAVVVSTTGERKVPGAGMAFVPLARSCKGWEGLQAQNVWLGHFNEAFVAAEPRPLCAFLSGNFIDWCQQHREDWRGTQEVLKGGHLPLWAACGGAQGLAILAETGVDRPWDCPQCRDPRKPLLPIYTHIRGSRKVKCGDYSGCVFERGPHLLVQLAADPVFAGLPREFRAVESHCGQIEWPPQGWILIATCGAGGKTKTQCLRVRDRYIYAAQFHIEMTGTPATSRAIMSNFLSLARQWGGYNLHGRPVAPPPPLAAR
jgi:hypothetical protein